MNLRVNLVLLAAAAIVVELFAAVSTPFLKNIARADVLQRARIMMEAAPAFAPIPRMKLRRC
jgi:hypothetical protein